MRGPYGSRVLTQGELDRLMARPETDSFFASVPERGASEAPVAIAQATAQAHAGLVPSVDTPLGDYSPYDYDTLRSYWEYVECSFYTDYKKAYRQNPFAYLVVEYLLNEIFGDGFHFEGEGADAMEEFLAADDTRRKLLVAFRQAVLLGNGFMDLRIGTVTGQLKETAVIDAITIGMSMENGVISYYQDPSLNYITRQAVTNGGGKPIDPDRLLHFRIKEYPDTPYGMSLLRPNLHLLRSLEDITNDIPAAVKRVAYSPLVAKLNLDNYATQADKVAVINDMAEKLHKVISATTNYVIDAKHDIGLVGSGGGAGARLLPLNDLIEPLIATVFFNFGIPLGMYLQQGANKSILAEQTAGVQRFIRHIQGSLKRDFERKVVPMVTGSMNATLVFDDGLADWISKGTFLARLFQLQMVSKEYATDTLNIVDNGKTFYKPPPTGGAPSAKLPLRDEKQTGATEE